MLPSASCMTNSIRESVGGSRWLFIVAPLFVWVERRPQAAQDHGQHHSLCLAGMSRH